MTELKNLKLGDVKSPTLNSDEYLEKYEEKVKEKFESYVPNSEIIDKIRQLLNNNHQALEIIVIGADWCPDCTNNIPSMIKIAKTLGNKLLNIRILYGVMVNAMRRLGDPLWHSKKSPPEALDPKFKLEKLPTFYIFDKNENLIGRIIEKPKQNSTLEKDLLEILELNFN
ncbi:MAG: thioredoxin family protein [Promethearchaeota archaeon]